MQYKLTSKGYIPLNEEELAEYNNRQDKWELEADDRAASTIRKIRNQKITSCDWTQVIDAPVDQEAWAVYRQALRDIPDQENFPNEVTWPEEPVTEKPVSEEPATEVVAEEPAEEVAPE